MRDLTGSRSGQARAVAGRLGRDDRGGIGVLIAILFASGVLLGVAALVVDVGLLYVVQGRLQDGADAAALAIARSCAAGSCMPSVAETYIGQNGSAGGPPAASLICGSADLGTCPEDGCGAADGSRQLTACPPSWPGQNFVDVSATATLGTAQLPMNFARTLLGSRSADSGQGTVAACAQAAWGAPASALVTALTVPYCAWYQATGGGQSYPPLPSATASTSPAPTADVVLRLGSQYQESSDGGCAGPGLGSFGWIQDQTGACSAELTGGYPGDSSGGTISAPTLCEQAIASAQAARTFLVIPVYTSMTSQYGVNDYQLAGFAAFVVTGYQFPDLSAPDWLNPAASCDQSASCVDGYFTKTLIPGTGTIGGQDLGTSIVSLSG